MMAEFMLRNQLRSIESSQVDDAQKAKLLNRIAKKVRTAARKMRKASALLVAQNATEKVRRLTEGRRRLVRLAREVMKLSRDARGKAQAQISVVKKQKPGARKVLIVDDDAHVRREAALALASSGYAVVVAADGDDGLAKARKHKPDLIISDIIMPKKNGYEMLDAISDNGSGPKAIMMAAYNTETHLERVTKPNNLEFITKPLDTDELVRKVDEMLPKKKSSAKKKTRSKV